MEIYGAGGPQGPQPIYPRLSEFTVDASRAAESGGIPHDRVEISPLGQMLDSISQIPDIRHERVEEIRQQIATGTYETPEKLEMALDRLLDELSGW